MMKPSRTTRLLENEELAKTYLRSAGAARNRNRIKTN
jgi:hypothetical protein